MVRQRRYGSRLARKESQRMLRQGLMFFVLAIILVLLLLFYGIPAMVKLAGFFGEVRNTTRPIDVDDSIAPFAPVITVDYPATFSAQIKVGGYAEAKASVVLYNNREKIDEVIADDDGEFEFTNIRLEAGENKLYAQAIDANGNESSLSKTETVVFDFEPPALTVESPGGEGDEVRVDTTTVEVSGTSEPGVRVWVNDRVAHVDSDGKFSVGIALNDGSNPVLVRAVDSAGNSSQAALTITR